MLECNAPGIEDANVWGLVNLKKGDKKAQRRILNSLHKDNSVLDVVNEIDESKKNRRVQFRNVKRELNLWKGTVHNNRLADQIIFPINDKAVVCSNSDKAKEIREKVHIDVIKKDNTSIQGKLYNALYKDSDKKCQSVNQNNEAMKRISKELMQKIALRNKERFLIARAAAKNKRQNKIKSKNFHRHLKSRTMKEYEKESEALRSSNPKKFAERLIKAELQRVKERASLRHRGGSKFAKLQKLRAKYDTEARNAVAEMHSISRDMTKKISIAEISDTDESDVDLTSESEVGSEESEVEFDGDDKTLFDDVTHNAWWKQETNSESSSKPNVGSLSTHVVEDILAKSSVSTSILPNSLTNENDLEKENEVLETVSEGFFRALQESCAIDPTIEKNFESEKSEVISAETPQDIDDYLPGWNDWTGPGTEKHDEERRKARLIRAPKVNRKDFKKSNVIIKRRINPEFKKHLVKSIPFPYNTPEQFESFISQPICREWTTESAHRELTKPKIMVQTGRIIKPISKSAAILRDKDVERFVKAGRMIEN